MDSLFSKSFHPSAILDWIGSKLASSDSDDRSNIEDESETTTNQSKGLYTARSEISKTVQKVDSKRSSAGVYRSHSNIIYDQHWNRRPSVVTISGDYVNDRQLFPLYKNLSKSCEINSKVQREASEHSYEVIIPNDCEIANGDVSQSYLKKSLPEFKQTFQLQREASPSNTESKIYHNPIPTTGKVPKLLHNSPEKEPISTSSATSIGQNYDGFFKSRSSLWMKLEDEDLSVDNSSTSGIPTTIVLDRSSAKPPSESKTDDSSRIPSDLPVLADADDQYRCYFCSSSTSSKCQFCDNECPPGLYCSYCQTTQKPNKVPTSDKSTQHNSDVQSSATQHDVIFRDVGLQPIQTNTDNKIAISLAPAKDEPPKVRKFFRIKVKAPNEPTTIISEKIPLAPEESVIKPSEIKPTEITPTLAEPLANQYRQITYSEWIAGCFSNFCFCLTEDRLILLLLLMNMILSFIGAILGASLVISYLKTIVLLNDVSTLFDEWEEANIM